MNENKKSELLNNKEFIKKIEKFNDLSYTIHEIKERGRFESFNNLMDDYKIMITNCLGDFLYEVDKKFEKFILNIEIKLEILTKQLKQEYNLTDEELEIISEDVEYVDDCNKYIFDDDEDDDDNYDCDFDNGDDDE